MVVRGNEQYGPKMLTVTQLPCVFISLLVLLLSSFHIIDLLSHGIGEKM